MNAMLGMADLLWETNLTAEQRRFLDSIRRNSNALLDLINGILDLAKVESGRLSLEWIVFDLRELAERVVETLGVKAHQKWIELAVRIAPGVPAELVEDPLRLRQILMNLIGNAIKFTERGEVVLEIEPWGSDPSASGTGRRPPMELETASRNSTICALSYATPVSALRLTVSARFLPPSPRPTHRRRASTGAAVSAWRL